MQNHPGSRRCEDVSEILETGFPAVPLPSMPVFPGTWRLTLFLLMPVLFQALKMRKLVASLEAAPTSEEALLFKPSSAIASGSMAHDSNHSVPAEAFRRDLRTQPAFVNYWT